MGFGVGILLADSSPKIPRFEGMFSPKPPQSVAVAKGWFVNGLLGVPLALGHLGIVFSLNLN